MSTHNPTVQQSSVLDTTKIRAKLKSKFDANPLNDSIYFMYSTIDRGIPKNGSTKNDILRITQFFHAISFFTSVRDYIDDAYLNYNNLRRGFLTDGALFRTEEKKDGDISIVEAYNCDDLSKLPAKKQNEILKEIDAQLNAIKLNTAEDTHIEKWYFWPGCEMKIPQNTTILVDTSVTKSKFVLTRTEEKTSNQANQVVLEEKPYQLEISSVGKNELYYDDSEEKHTGNKRRKLKSGFFSINKSGPQFEKKENEEETTGFYEIELALKNGQDYEYTLYVPYDTAKFDVKTDMKIFGAEGQVVDEFIATCS